MHVKLWPIKEESRQQETDRWREMVRRGRKSLRHIGNMFCRTVVGEWKIAPPVGQWRTQNVYFPLHQLFITLPRYCRALFGIQNTIQPPRAASIEIRLKHEKWLLSWIMMRRNLHLSLINITFALIFTGNCLMLG